MDMEGDCKATGAAAGDATLCVPVPSSMGGISEYVRASDSMTSLSDTVEFGSASASGSNLVSSRIERMMRERSEYIGSEVEFEIDASKVHWSQSQSLTSDDEEGNSETDLEVFQRLRQKWGDSFFRWGGDLEVGEKIGEGGQAEIFKLVWTDPELGHGYVLKVFKEGFALRGLEKQWPLGMLQYRKVNALGFISCCCCLIASATLLKNGRFAFLMLKYWGDLRKLIDLRMQRNHNKLPPFTEEEVGDIMVQIVEGMVALHEHNIVHRDLKASNVLIVDLDAETFKPPFNPSKNSIHCSVADVECSVGVVRKRYSILCSVADFECSVGVVGTGYWRAPEILRAVQVGGIKSRLFTEKSDVYSFAMTYYEVLTGCIPLEGLDHSCYNVVIEGQRPKLPEHVDVPTKSFLSRCWHGNPSERPTFGDIREHLIEKYPSHYA